MKRMYKIIYLLLVLIFFPLKGFPSVNYEELPLNILREMAEKGDAKAQNELSVRFFDGNGVPQSDKEAYYWLHMAAEQGFDDAQYGMGYFYEMGIFVEKNYEESLKWYMLAAKQNYSAAQLAVGNFFLEGKGTKEDLDQAHYWLKKSAENGDEDGQLKLGLFYLRNSKFYDVPMGLRWLERASSQNNSEAQLILGKMYLQGDIINKDWEKAVEYLKKAAEHNNLIAINLLGSCYENGLGVNQDFNEALKCYKLAASKGNPNALNNLGTCYFNGNGVTQNYKEAIRQYLLAAEQNNAVAQSNLGVCYLYGYGVSKNQNEAMRWFNLAAAQGDKKALNYLRDLGYEYSPNQSTQPPINELIPNKHETDNLDSKSSIDIEIPQNPVKNATNTFAVIIANENYHSVSNVPYASKDGEVLEKYLTRAVGLPGEHVKLYKNASFGNIAAALKHIENLSEAFGKDLNLIFYYAGHGMPNEKTKNPMLIPVDGDAAIPETCYELDKVISTLGNLNANSVVVMLDACFSGTERGDGMLMAARGIRIKSNQSEPTGNMVILSASQGDETAYPFDSEQHGLFTYFLLKKLQEKNGDVTLGELADYVTEQVKRQSVVSNGKLQTPTVSVSPTLQSSWRNLKLK